MDTAVEPHSNADLYNQIGRTAEKLGTTISGLAKEANDKKDLATMNESMSEANIQAMEFTQKWRVDNEADPRNPQAIAEYKQGIKDIYSQYSEGISIQNRPKWAEVSSKLWGKNAENNMAWAYKQEVVNAENSINKSKANNIEVAGQLGSIGDVEGALDLYKDSRAGLYAFGEGIFSEQKLTKMLDDYESEYMESVLGGMLESNPQRAKEFLNDPRVKESLRSVDREKTLTDLADKKEIEINDAIFEEQVGNEVLMTEVLFDDTKTSVQKMAELNRQEDEGLVSEEYAELGRLLLKSKDSLKAVPNTPEETELIVLSSMLKQQLGTNPSVKSSKSFLRKKREFNKLALEYQKSGRVTKTSAEKILKSLNDAESKATGKVASQHGYPVYYDDADVYKAFKNDLGDSLYQAEAIRQYFYATDGKKITDDQRKKLATEIIQKMKAKSLDPTDKSGGLEVGAIVDGYRYLGGDRYDEKNWEKVNG